MFVSIVQEPAKRTWKRFSDIISNLLWGKYSQIAGERVDAILNNLLKNIYMSMTDIYLFNVYCVSVNLHIFNI